jgi:hypothetical protein
VDVIFLSLAIFVVSAQWNLLTVQILNQVGSGRLGVAAAFSVILIIIFLGVIAVIAKIIPGREGDRAECTIRLEGIRIMEVANTEQAPFVGTVQRATFLGSVVEYEVSVEGLSRLLVQTSNPLEGRIHKVWSSVRVNFPPGTLHVLAPES